MWLQVFKALALILPLGVPEESQVAMGWGDVLDIEMANSAGKTLSLHPSIHPSTQLLS